MATELGKAYVQIIPSAKGISGSIGKIVDPEAESAGESAGARLGGSLVSKLKTVLIAAGIGKLITGAITQGGELEQNIGGTEAVFGEFAGNIQDSAQDAYKNMGLSASDYMATANKMGSLFQGSGMDQQKSLDMTSDAMQRAADVASVMGIDTSMAMESIAGAAKGNFTMMDNLGVAMNATALSAYALEKGINFNWNTATQAEKSELAMKMFMDRTSQYAGNFARESEETFSGSLGAMKSSWQNLLGDLTTGQDISGALSAFGNTITTFASNLIPMLSSLISQLPQVLITVLLEAAPQLVIAGAQLVADILNGFTASLPTLIPMAIEAISTIVIGLLNSIPMLIEAALSLVIGLAQGLMAAIPVLLEEVPKIIDSLIDAILDSIPLIVQAGIDLLTALVEDLPIIIDTIITKIPEIIDSVITKVIGAIPQIIEAGVQLLTSLVTNLPTIITTIVNALPQIIMGIVNTLINNIPLIIDAGVQLITALITNLPQIILTIVAAIPQIIGAIVGGFGDMMGQIINIGGDIARGIWEGIKGLAGWLWDKVSGWASDLWSGIKNFFGISSPSKLFATAGEALSEGLAVGITDNLRPVQNAMDALEGETERTFGAEMALSASTSLDSMASAIVTGAGNKQALAVTFSLSGHKFKALVDDITKLQDREVELALAY